MRWSVRVTVGPEQGLANHRVCHHGRVSAPPHRRVRPRRGPVRRYLEARGVIGGHRRPAVLTRLKAADGTTLVATYLPGPADAEAAALVVHGFGASARKPAYARLADGLAARVPVLALDLRGHGRSGGRTTLGDAEQADVLAAAAWLGRIGHPRVVAIGASLGGTAVLRAAGSGLAAVGVVAISAPARWRPVAPPGPLQRIERIWHSAPRRAALRVVLGVRLAPPERWNHPDPPQEAVGRWTGPLLVVHGEADPYFPITDAEALVGAAGGPAVLWRQPASFGHAEDGLGPGLIAALRAAVVEVAVTGRFPDQPPAPAPPRPVTEG